jgi:5-methylcytosine-specific restriction endonuclease McrA
MTQTVATKKCSKCEVVKSRDAFSKDAKRKSGLQPQCKECFRAYYQANKRVILDRATAWQKSHADHRREYIRDYAPRWREANPDKVRAARSKTDAVRRAAELSVQHFTISQKDMRRLAAQSCAHRHLGPCSGRMEMDHVVPVSKGGNHGIGNLQMLCRHHNSSKSNNFESTVRLLKGTAHVSTG